MQHFLRVVAPDLLQATLCSNRTSGMIVLEENDNNLIQMRYGIYTCDQQVHAFIRHDPTQVFGRTLHKLVNRGLLF